MDAAAARQRNGVEFSTLRDRSSLLTSGGGKGAQWSRRRRRLRNEADFPTPQRLFVFHFLLQQLSKEV